MESQKRPDHISLFLTFVFVAVFVFVISWHFEYKYLNILAKSSMVDETEELTFLERKEIKDTIAFLYKEYSLPVRFRIGENEVEVPAFNVPTLYIGINTENNKVLVYGPSVLGNKRDMLMDRLETCLDLEEQTRGICLNDALLYLTEIIQ